MEERLQKLMARAGLGSRRSCEDMIVEGRVTVNGKRAELGHVIFLLVQRAQPRRKNLQPAPGQSRALRPMSMPLTG